MFTESYSYFIFFPAPGCLKHSKVLAFLMLSHVIIDKRSKSRIGNKVSHGSLLVILIKCLQISTFQALGCTAFPHHSLKLNLSLDNEMWGELTYILSHWMKASPVRDSSYPSLTSAVIWGAHVDIKLYYP